MSMESTAQPKGSVVLTFEGLSRLESLELQRALPTETVQTREEPLDDRRHGELATVTVIVIVSLAAVRGLSAWLQKRRKHGSIKFRRETRSARGDLDIVTIQIDESDEQPLAADTLQGLANLLQIDPSLVTAVSTSE